MKIIISALTAMLVVRSTLLAAEDRRIGAINFYGYSGLDLKLLRSALPFHEGEPLPLKEQLARAQAPFAKAIGRSRVKFSPNCCLPDGRMILFVGIEEPAATPIVYNSKPTGTARLPADIVKLYQDHEREIGNGVRQGVGSEDDSQGYRLLAYPPARALELRMLEYARAHSIDLIKVLDECADDTHRAAAADVLGYATAANDQIAALARASVDRNADVRDEATRALAILVNHDPQLLQQIPLRRYVALLHSIDWLDRNKAASLIEAFTRTRDPNVLQMLRSEALTPLREIAQWKDFSHALCAFESLGRIAGLEEQRIDELSLKEDVGPILHALP